MEEIKSQNQKSNPKEFDALKKIGNLIKEARLNRNQSIEELASNLKIGAHQLKAIEDGNKDYLPEEVFVKAMIRRISDKLKLDTEFIMDELKESREEVKIEESVDEVSNNSLNKRKTKNFNPISFVVLILISGIFGLITSSLIFNYFSESSQNQTPKQELIQKN